MEKQCTRRRENLSVMLEVEVWRREILPWPADKGVTRKVRQWRGLWPYGRKFPPVLSGCEILRSDDRLNRRALESNWQLHMPREGKRGSQGSGEED